MTLHNTFANGAALAPPHFVTTPNRLPVCEMTEAGREEACRKRMAAGCGLGVQTGGWRRGGSGVGARGWGGDRGPTEGTVSLESGFQAHRPATLALRGESWMGPQHARARVLYVDIYRARRPVPGRPRSTALLLGPRATRMAALKASLAFSQQARGPARQLHRNPTLCRLPPSSAAHRCPPWRPPAPPLPLARPSLTLVRLTASCG